MANGIVCGFETGDFAECSASAGTVSIQNSVARNGGYALRVNPTTTGTGSATIKGHDSTGIAASSAFSATTAYHQFYFRVDTLPASNYENIARFYATNDALKAYLSITSAGVLTFRNSGNVLVSTGTTVLSTGVWYRIGIKIEADTGANCDYEVQIDGVSEFTGTTTLGSANNGYLQLGKVANLNSQTVDFYYDDVISSDSAFPSAGQCERLLPNANGNYQDWTIGAGAGSHYENVDEIPHDGNTTYLLSSSSAAETVALGSLASSPQSIASMKTFIVVARDGGASNGEIQKRSRSGSTDTDLSSYLTASSTYVLLADVQDTDPATGAAWTNSGLNGLEVGAVSALTLIASRMTLAGAMVYYTPSSGPPAGSLPLLGVG